MHEAAEPHLLDFVVDRLEVGIFAVDSDMNVVLWNHFMSMHSGRNADEIIGKNLFTSFPELPQTWLEKKLRNVFLLKNYAFTSWEQRPYLFRFNHNRPVTGGIDAMQQNCTFLPVQDEDGRIKNVCITLFDFTDTALYHRQLTSAIGELEQEKAEQRRLIEQLEEAHNQVLQSEKLASIGQLAAGVAHEINNPVGFVNSNFGTLERYVNDLFSLIDAYSQPEGAVDAQAIKKKIDYDFLKEDIVELFKESQDGLGRVKRIVQDLRDFSRVDSSHEWQKTNLHTCLDTTLSVATNEIRHKASVVKDYGAIPEVECLPSQLNQVLLNLMVNAAQAMTSGTLTLATGTEDDWVWIAVSDTGNGIAPEHLKHIFDPFFTTKPVGKGTGLGLSVSYSIIAKHNGRIEVDSEVGRGTTFRVWLPIKQKAD